MARMFDIREPSIEALRVAPVYFRYGANRRRVLVDQLTASAILAVYDALSEEHKAKVARMLQEPAKFYKLAGFAFKHCKVA